MMRPDPPESDADLVARANAGDAAAFEVLYLRYRDWVTNLACRFTRGDRELALDVMQDTFMHLLRRFPGFTLTAQLKTYLYPVVRHTALALARKQRRASPPPLREGARGWVERTAVEGVWSHETVNREHDDLANLQSALGSLDAGQREVLLLRFADDLSLQEIALAMGIPLGTVKSRLHNALATLRQNARLRSFFEEP
jgi:RNA polymerase sigma-70 factor (ECF subfamily)